VAAVGEIAQIQGWLAIRLHDQVRPLWHLQPDLKPLLLCRPAGVHRRGQPAAVPLPEEAVQQLMLMQVAPPQEELVRLAPLCGEERGG
jgi:hypothetical protein